MRLADGLDAIQPEDKIDTIVVAGMGGTLIRSILEEGSQKNRLAGVKRLVLQPNVGERTLREWLVDHNFTIIHEVLLEENDKNYEIIVAETGKATYTTQQLFFGPFLLKEKNPVFLKKWQHELKQRQRVVKELEKAKEPPAEKMNELKEQIEWIKEVLA